MRRRGRIIRMDKWETYRRVKGEPCSDMVFRPSLHRHGDILYFSLHRRTKQGKTFSEIKGDTSMASVMADEASRLIHSLLGDPEGWAILTTPQRRHFGDYHFATDVCSQMSELLYIPFYAGAVQCVNRHRIDPEFHNLLPIPESKVIIFDDIITTGSTLKATIESLGERQAVISIVGIRNR